jgi:hypothetical protein
MPITFVSYAFLYVYIKPRHLSSLFPEIVSAGNKLKQFFLAQRFTYKMS